MDNKRRRKFKKCLKDIDLFGFPIGLNYNGKGGGGVSGSILSSPQHQTLGGGIITIAFLLVAVVII